MDLKILRSPNSKTDKFCFRRPLAKIGGAQQGSGYQASRKKWWRREFRELNGIIKYLGILQGVGDTRRQRKKIRIIEKRRMRKKRKMCSNFKRIEKMEDCEDIRKQIWILCFTSKVPKYTGSRVG